MLCTVFHSFCIYAFAFIPGFFWVDETGCCKRNGIRKFGHAIKRGTPICYRILVKGQRISVIAAMSTEGLVTLNLKSSGSMNSDTFYDFIWGSLKTLMHPFLGNPKSIHHISEVEQLFDAV